MNGENEKNGGMSERLEEIKEMGSVERSNIRTFTVIGQIEGHYMLGDGQKSTKYEHIIPALADAEQDDDIKGLLFLLNTMGGDVEAGLAIAEMISGMSKPTASVVLGGGHSIGVPLAVAARRSFIVPSATMTLHPVRLNGTVIGVPQTYNYLERMQERITGFIAAHSNIKREELQGLMMRTDELANDVGTIIDGVDAVSCGLIDEIGGVKDAVAYLRSVM